LALPVAIGLDLVQKNRAVFAAMPCQIALTVAIDVEPPRHAPAQNRLLPNRGADRPSLPGNVAREPHIQGQQAPHHTIPSSCGSIKTTAVSDLNDRFRRIFLLAAHPGKGRVTQCTRLNSCGMIRDSDFPIVW
jgi:hypothetical protein